MNWQRSGTLGETKAQRHERLLREHREQLERLQRRQTVDGVGDLPRNASRDAQDGPLARLRRLAEVIDRLARGERPTARFSSPGD